MIWSEKQRLRPGDAVFCVIDRPSLVSLIFFLYVRFLWRALACCVVTRPHNDKASTFPQFMFYISSRLKAQITVVIDMACSTNIIRIINTLVVPWPSHKHLLLFSTERHLGLTWLQNNRLELYCVRNTCNRPSGRKNIYRQNGYSYRYDIHIKTSSSISWNIWLPSDSLIL